MRTSGAYIARTEKHAVRHIAGYGNQVGRDSGNKKVDQ